MNELHPDNNWAMVDWDPTLTESSHAAACDINAQLKLYGRPELIPSNGRQPRSVDTSEIGDYLDAFEQVRAAQELYDSLPAQVHDQFASAQEFLEFVDDPANSSQLAGLGLTVTEDKKVEKKSEILESSTKTD